MLSLLSLLPSQIAGGIISAIVWRHYRRRTYPANHQYFTFWSRFWSGTVDNFVLWPLLFILTALMLLEPPNWVLCILFALYVSYTSIYTALMHARFGQTAGKMVTGVRVVDAVHGGPISTRQAWIREAIPLISLGGLLTYQLVLLTRGQLTIQQVLNGHALRLNPWLWLLVSIPALWFLAEILTMLTNDRRRALHDYIAGTVVIRTRLDEEEPRP